ncbi:MAG: efflux RND transporter periplasmic adaptor subunit [Kiritimatiellia bacterium]|jgi:multidrug efflux system membrane fusion protein
MNRYLRSSIGILHRSGSTEPQLHRSGSTEPQLHRSGVEAVRENGKVAERLIHAGAVALCSLLILTLGACSKRQKGPPQFPPTAVQTTLAVKMDTPVVISAFGNTEDQVSVDVVPQVSGLLVKTFILDGAIVTNGQALFLIDPSDYVIRVRQADGLVAADRANLELSRLTLERNRPLLAKSMISAETFDTLKTKLDAAAAQLKIDEATLDQARLDLSRCTVTSSVNGICSKRFLDNGNLAVANQTKLTNVRSYDPIFVEFSVSEQYLDLLRREMAAGTVRVEVAPRGDTNSYAGELVFLDNAVNQQTGTILLRALVPNPERKLWAQQFIEVRILAGTARAAVMVPESAVQFGKDGPYAFVVTQDNKADLRPVKPGVRYDSLLQIEEGVASGEKVVVLGQLMLYPGAVVMEAAPLTPSGKAPAGAPEGK